MGIINQKESSVIQREGNSGIVDYKIPTGVQPVPRQGKNDVYMKPKNAEDQYACG